MPRTSGYCFAHDPELQGKAQEARRAGGYNKSNAARAVKRMPRDAAQISQLIEGAMGAVYKGTLTPQQGSALASLAGAWVRLHEHGELEGRLAELEARAAATMKDHHHSSQARR